MEYNQFYVIRLQRITFLSCANMKTNYKTLIAIKCSLFIPLTGDSLANDPPAAVVGVGIVVQTSLGKENENIMSVKGILFEKSKSGAIVCKYQQLFMS